MNAAQMEDLLRDALRARADEVVQLNRPVRPLDDERRRGTVRPWLIPLAAAAAVVALLGAVFVGRSMLREDDAPSPTATGPHVLDAPPAAPPPSFLGIRNGSLQQFQTATGAARTLMTGTASTTVSSAAVAADGTIYFTQVQLNNSASGQLWRIAPGGAPELILDPPDWAPRAVALRDGVLAVAAGSRENGQYRQVGIVLLRAGDLSEVRRIEPASLSDADLRGVSYLSDGRLAVQLAIGATQRSIYLLDPAAAARVDDGAAIPVDPGWSATAITSGAGRVVVAFWSGQSVEVNEVDPATLVSMRTLYSSQDGAVVTQMDLDQGGALLIDRDSRISGAGADANSTPLVVLDGTATAVPGLEPPDVPPIDVVRVMGWVG